MRFQIQWSHDSIDQSDSGIRLSLHDVHCESPTRNTKVHFLKSRLSYRCSCVFVFAIIISDLSSKIYANLPNFLP